MMSRRLLAVVALALSVTLLGCSREEKAKDKKSPIQVAVLPTPKSATRVTDALGTATPMSAHTPAAAAPATKAGAAAKPTEPASAPKATEAAPTTAAVPKPPLAETTASPAMLGKAAVPKGTDILDGPSADATVLGTFEGKTNVDRLEVRDDYTRVRAPVIGGTSVEGWVASSAVKAKEKTASMAKAAPAVPAKAPEGAPAAKPAPAKPAAAAAAPKAAPAKGGNGPEDILLKAIAGMTAKRPATPFTHKKHFEDYSVKCVDCHHAVKAKGGTVLATKTCTDAGCHEANQCNSQVVPAKNKACPFFEDAYHYNCIECHRAQSGPTKCAECHAG